jgi:hypothetical protein
MRPTLFRCSISKLAAIALVFIGLLGCKKDEGKKYEAVKTKPLETPQGPPSHVPNAPVATATGVPDEWDVVEEFDFDWQGNGTPAHFKLERHTGQHEPSRLTIQIKGHKDFILKNDDRWVEYETDFQPEENFLKINKNLSTSSFVLFLHITDGLPPMAFLESWDYASDPERLHVIGLGADGNPKLLFNQIFHIADLVDLDGDGTKEMAGLPCFSQSWGNGFLTYDPYNVYKFPSLSDSRATLSLELSKEYNLKEYYGWAGAACSEKLAVVLHPPNHGKPVIVKSSEAEKMFEKTD